MVLPVPPISPEPPTNRPPANRAGVRGPRLIARLAITLLVIAGAAVAVDSRSAPSAQAVAAPTSTATAPTPTAPIWLPFRAPMKIGCVRSNCAGPYHGYWAIDFESLVNAPGAPVYAAGSGRVKITGRGAGCGGPGAAANVLTIDHGNGVESVYVHLRDFAVPTGAWVTPNTIIGHVGSVGHTIPCPDYHLHFEVRHNRISVNPGPLLACQGWKLISYPGAVGYLDWNSVVAQEGAGGPLDPRGRELYSDGTNCSTQPYGSSIAVARDGNGRLDVIASSSADRVHEARQGVAGGSTWSAWSPAGAGMHSVAAETNADGRLENFGLSFNGVLYHRRQTSVGGPWSPWTTWPNASGFYRSVAVTRAGDGRLEVIAVSAANIVYTAAQSAPNSASWSAWTSSVGFFRTVAAETNRDGRMEVFGISRGGLLNHRWQRTPGGSWTGWIPWPQPSGQFRTLAVARGGDGRLELIATSSNDVVYQAHQSTAGSSAWSRFVAVAGLMRGVAAETDQNGRVVEFGVSRAHGLLYLRRQTSVGGAWTGWQPFSTALTL